MGIEIEKNPIIFINGGENVNHVSSKKNNVGYNVSNVCDDPQLNSLEPITKTNFLQRQSKFIKIFVKHLILKLEEVQIKYSSWYENIWISLFNYLPTLRRSSHWPKQANQETRDIRYAISKGCNRFFKDDLHSTKWHRFGSKKSKCSVWLCQVFIRTR